MVEIADVKAWKPDLRGVSEIFHATFSDHVYPMHCHDTWAVLIVDAGEVRYGIDQHDRGIDTRSVTVLPPYVPHDGRSAVVGSAFRKRVLYLDAHTLDVGLIGAAVDDSTISDSSLRKAIAALHGSFDAAEDDLSWESCLDLVVERIHSHLGSEPLAIDMSRTDAAETLRDYLDADPFAHHKLGEIAGLLGWSTTHLIRSFTTAFGIPPHRYLISRRVEEARHRILGGQALSEVAVAVGFHDQAHLTRHFKAQLGVTPGRFQRSFSCLSATQSNPV